MAKCKISVVVPVYKVEQYLDRCVKSLLAQTLCEFELILVDDGSPDHCPQLCDAWVEKDSRVRAIHKVNGGPQDAVKCGVSQAKGDYITFVDSDDWVEPTYLQTLYEGVRMYDADLAQCNFRKLQGDQVSEVSFPAKVLNKENLKNDLLPRMANYTFTEMSNSRWCKIYRASLLREAMALCDVSIRIGEDFLMNFAVLGLCEKAVVLDSPPLYNYCFNELSIMGSFNIDKMLNQDAFYRNLVKIAEVYQCPQKDVAHLINEDYIRYIYMRAISSEARTVRKKEIQRILDAMDRKIWYPMIGKHSVLAERICLYLCYLGQVNLMLLLLDVVKKLKGIG